MDKKLLNILRNKIRFICKNLNAYLLQSCIKFKDFKGRDIDAIFNKDKQFKILMKNLIVRDKNKNNLRFHINSPQSNNFLSLDFQDLTAHPKKYKEIFTKNFNKKIFCEKTELYHLDEKSIIFLKLYKYFHSSIFSKDQLKELKYKIFKLNKNDHDLVYKLIIKVLPDESAILKKFFYLDFDKFINTHSIKKFLISKKLIRDKKRLVFNGKLNFKNAILSKKFIYAFIFGIHAKWKKKHNPMPAIAIIGNDGSGKTTIVEHIRKNFYKMDPLIINMRTPDPYFSLTNVLTKLSKKLKKYNLIKKTFLFNSILIFERLIIFFDKYIKYKIGMAWADSGSGLTIFERYPSDKVRGEFPNKNNKFLPIEQFFPFPDGIIYLDVLPNESLKRKKNDKHSLEEMKSKRENYLKLIQEFDEIITILSTKNIEEKMKLTKNYIFGLYFKKKKKINISGKNKRLVWKKNYNRVLAGNKIAKR